MRPCAPGSHRSGVGDSVGGDFGAGLTPEGDVVRPAMAAHPHADDLQGEAKRLALGSWASAEPGDLLGAVVRATLAR